MKEKEEIFVTAASKQSTTIPRRTNILEDWERWKQETANKIKNEKGQKQYREDVEWFVLNHKETYYDKKKGRIQGCYYGHDTSNGRVVERFQKYLENKRSPKKDNQKWLVPIYKNIPIDEIIRYLKNRYGN